VKQQLVESKPVSIAELGKIAAKQHQDMVNLDTEGELRIASSNVPKVESSKDLAVAAAKETGAMVGLDDGHHSTQGAGGDSEAVKQAEAREARIKAALPSASQAASSDSEAVKQAYAREAKIEASLPSASSQTQGSSADSEAVKQAEKREAKIEAALPSANSQTHEDSDRLLKDAEMSEHKEESAMSEFRMGKQHSAGGMEALQKRATAAKEQGAKNQGGGEKEVQAKGRARLQHSLANSVKSLVVHRDDAQPKRPSEDDNKLLQDALGSQRQDEAEVDSVTQRGRKGQEEHDVQGKQTLSVDADHGKVPKSVLTEAKQLAMARGDDINAEFAGEKRAVGGAGSALVPKSVAPGKLAKHEDEGKLLALAKEAQQERSGDEGDDQSYFQAEKARAGQQALSQGPWLPKNQGLLKLARQAMRSQDAETKAGKTPAARLAKHGVPQGKTGVVGGKGAVAHSGVAVRT
jgi:NH3-dependent NAD+ synthetase